MATRIRLRRLGAKKRPFYRVVVADQRTPRDGRFIENIGKYHPLDDPSLIEIDEERALHWLRVGAQPSDQVRNLMVKVGIWDRFVAERPSAAALVRIKTEQPVKEKVSKKAAAKAAEGSAAAAPAADAAEPVAAEPAADAAGSVAAEPAADAAGPVAAEPAADAAPLGDPQAEVPQAEFAPDVGAESASDSAAPSDEASEATEA